MKEGKALIRIQQISVLYLVIWTITPFMEIDNIWRIGALVSGFNLTETPMNITMFLRKPRKIIPSNFISMVRMGLRKYRKVIGIV